MDARRATVADRDEMIRLAAVMFAAVGIDETGPEWRVNGLASLEAGERDGSVAGFVVDDPKHPGRLLASAAVVIQRRLPTPMAPDGRIGFVQWVATDPDARRRGLARAAMLAVLDWLREQGVTRVELFASPDGEGLYRTLGFQQPPRPAYSRALDEPVDSEPKAPWG